MTTLFRRGIGIAALSVSVFATLSGCGGSDDNNNTPAATPTPAPTASPVASPAASPAASPSSDPIIEPSPVGTPTVVPSPDPTPKVIITTASGLQYRDDVIGTGAEVTNGATVTMHYTGTFQNGMKFDSSLDPGRQPFTFTTDTTPPQVIAGFNEGVKGMKVGGKRFLILPSDLAYGPRGAGSIPPNTPINFDIEILGVR